MNRAYGYLNRGNASNQAVIEISFFGACVLFLGAVLGICELSSTFFHYIAGVSCTRAKSKLYGSKPKSELYGRKSESELYGPKSKSELYGSKSKLYGKVVLNEI